MSYEVDSKKTILITEDIYRMLPVVRTVSLPVIILAVSHILWISSRATLFHPYGRAPSDPVCASSFTLQDLSLFCFFFLSFFCNGGGMDSTS